MKCLCEQIFNFYSLFIPFKCMHLYDGLNVWHSLWGGGRELQLVAYYVYSLTPLHISISQRLCRVLIFLDWNLRYDKCFFFSYLLASHCGNEMTKHSDMCDGSTYIVYECLCFLLLNIYSAYYILYWLCRMHCAQCTSCFIHRFAILRILFVYTFIIIIIIIINGRLWLVLLLMPRDRLVMRKKRRIK